MSSLTLSGGGFRAMLFHLGVVNYLRASNKLGQVERIYAVSGGSILAAHLALKWDKYKSEDIKDFAEAANHLLQICGRNVRGRVLRRWALYWLWAVFVALLPFGIALAFCPSWWSIPVSLAWTAIVLGVAYWLLPRRWWSRIKGLEREYEFLFQRTSLANLPKSPQGPEVHLLSTDLTSGKPCSFSQNGLVMFYLDSTKEPPQLVPEHAKEEAKSLTIARVVAASSAYPALFPPVELNHRHFGPQQSELPYPHQLTDGGVYENLGVRVWRVLQPADAVITAADVVSDAQRENDEKVGKRFTWLWDRFLRATDVLMNRITALEYAELKTGAPTRVQLAMPVEGLGALPPDIQNFIRGVRTDLDVFSPAEIQLLVYQGYAVARRKLEESKPAIAEEKDVQIIADTHMPFQLPGSRMWLPYKVNAPGFKIKAKRALWNSSSNARGWLRALLGGWNSAPVLLLFALSLWLAKSAWDVFHPPGPDVRVEELAPVEVGLAPEGANRPDYTEEEAGQSLRYSDETKTCLLVRLPAATRQTTISAEIRPCVTVTLVGVAFSRGKPTGTPCTWDKAHSVLHLEPLPCQQGESIHILVGVPEEDNKDPMEDAKDKEAMEILKTKVGPFLLSVNVNGRPASIRDLRR